MDLNFWFLLAVWYLLRHFKESRYICPITSCVITSFYVQHRCLGNINLYAITGIEKVPTDLMVSVPCLSEGSPNIKKYLNLWVLSDCILFF